MCTSKGTDLTFFFKEHSGHDRDNTLSRGKGEAGASENSITVIQGRKDDSLNKRVLDTRKTNNDF